MRLILLWLLNALALLAVAYLLPSIQVASFGSAMVAALVLGLVNAVLRPLLLLLTLPVTLLTLGLFLFVLNGLMFWLAGSLLEGFVVGGFTGDGDHVAQEACHVGLVVLGPLQDLYKKVLCGRVI